MKCKSCRRTLVHRPTWKATPRDHRDHRTHAIIEARGLCHSCHQRASAAGTLCEYERMTVPRDEVLSEWELFRDPGVSRAENVRRLAVRLGMTEGALSKALDRAARVAA